MFWELRDLLVFEAVLWVLWVDPPPTTTSNHPHTPISSHPLLPSFLEVEGQRLGVVRVLFRLFLCLFGDDDELMLNVLRCQLTY